MNKPTLLSNRGPHDILRTLRRTNIWELVLLALLALARWASHWKKSYRWQLHPAPLVCTRLRVSGYNFQQGLQENWKKVNIYIWIYVNTPRHVIVEIWYSVILLVYGDIHSHEGNPIAGNPNCWMVYLMENPIKKRDDLGGPPWLRKSPYLQWIYNIILYNNASHLICT